MTDDVAMFGTDPPPLTRRDRERARNARRRGHRRGHPCTACGRRTYRRPRVYPVQGFEDARCQTCVNRGLWPDQHTDQRGAAP